MVEIIGKKNGCKITILTRANTLSSHVILAYISKMHIDCEDKIKYTYINCKDKSKYIYIYQILPSLFYIADIIILIQYLVNLNMVNYKNTNC